MLSLKNKKLKSRMVLFFVALGFLLSACQSSTPVQKPVVKKTVKRNSGVVDKKSKPLWNEVKKVEKEKIINPVVAQLLSEAVLLRKQGDYSQAIITAERALEIDTKEVKVYIELAKIRQAQGEISWARQLLLKAKRLSRDKKTSKEINRQLSNL